MPELRWPLTTDHRQYHQILGCRYGKKRENCLHTFQVLIDSTVSKYHKWGDEFVISKSNTHQFSTRSEISPQNRGPWRWPQLPRLIGYWTQVTTLVEFRSLYYTHHPIHAYGEWNWSAKHQWSIYHMIITTALSVYNTYRPRQWYLSLYRNVVIGGALLSLVK